MSNKKHDEFWDKFPEESLPSQDYQHTEPQKDDSFLGKVKQGIETVKDWGTNIVSNIKSALGIDSNKETPQQTTTTNPSNSATGSGIDGALGMEYSWDTKAEDRANLDYETAVLKSKENYLTNRQELESQGQQMQQQVDMQKYSQNQSNEKAGWTGGYVLDTERQMEYLKQTIQSQMYGAMELQKYGYDTSLAAARLAYETNKFDLALKYYNDAVSQALSESDRTGYYISPEVKEHLNAYSIASKILEDPASSEADKQRASTILNGIDKWFADNGISKQGVETLAQKNFIETLKKTAESMITYTGDEEIFQIDWDTVVKVDENGVKQFTDDSRSMETLTFSKMSTEEILEYASIGEIAKQQVFGYIDNLLERDIQKYLDSVKTTTGSGDSAVTTYNISSDSFNKFIADKSMAIINNLLTEASSEEIFKEIFSGYALTTELDKSTIYFAVDSNGKLTYKINQANLPESTNGNTGSDEPINSGGTPGVKTKMIDGLETTWDTTTNTAKNSKYTYTVDSEGQFKKTGYNFTSTDDLYNKLKEDNIKTGQKIVIDMYKPMSEWGDKIDQSDFDSKNQKGKAKEYIEALIADAKAGKIPLGARVQLNYGNQNIFGGANYTYVYIGNGQFAKCIVEMAELPLMYAPKGYDVEKNNIPPNVYKD